jgi:MoeA N-terminal region (domain I and II)
MNTPESPGSGFRPAGDPRLKGFQNRIPVLELWNWIKRTVQPLESEEIRLPRGSGRVLAREITPDVALPPFDRAAMDGCALRPRRRSAPQTNRITPSEAHTKHHSDDIGHPQDVHPSSPIRPASRREDLRDIH